jgi:hypothetical protein
MLSAIADTSIAIEPHAAAARQTRYQLFLTSRRRWKGRGPTPISKLAFANRPASVRVRIKIQTGSPGEQKKFAPVAPGSRLEIESQVKTPGVFMDHCAS